MSIHRFLLRKGHLQPVLLALLLPVVACGSDSASASEEETASETGFVKIVNVEVAAITAGEFTSFVRITGEAEAENDITVSAEEGGKLVRFFAEKGERVSRGAAIAKIDDEILRAQVDEARASADLDRERYLRQKQVWEEERIGSEITYLQTKAQAEQANARLSLLQARLDRTTIRSPVAGILDDRYVDAGEVVSPGTRVARVVDIGRLKITGGVPERFGPFIQAGGAAVIMFDVLSGREFDGTIGYVGAAVDPQSRTFPIEILMANPDGAVKPQMIANVRVATDRLEDVVVVPQEVVLRTELGYQVFVVAERDGSRLAEARPVVLGPSFENRVVIESGLEPGDLLVTRGHQLVDPGDHVRVVGDDGGAR
jgi:RND family efflux transporter MFP subunit